MNTILRYYCAVLLVTQLFPDFKILISVLVYDNVKCEMQITNKFFSLSFFGTDKIKIGVVFSVISMRMKVSFLLTRL